MNTHTWSSSYLQEPTWRKMTRKTWKHESMLEWANTFGFLLAEGVKMCFPNTDGFCNSNLSCHTLPIPCNNQLNQFLAVINDWVSKTRKVVDNLMGSPSDIWPQRFKEEGCGFLINCIFTWRFKIATCLASTKYHQHQFNHRNIK